MKVLVLLTTIVVLLSAFGFFLNKETAPSNGNDVTIYEYEFCLNTDCNGYSCPADDTECNTAAQDYRTCVYNNEFCQEYQDFKDSHDADQPLPETFFQCQEACQPTQDIGSYKYFQQCQEKCYSS